MPVVVKDLQYAIWYILYGDYCIQHSISYLKDILQYIYDTLFFTIWKKLWHQIWYDAWHGKTEKMIHDTFYELTTMFLPIW